MSTNDPVTAGPARTGGTSDLLDGLEASIDEDGFWTVDEARSLVAAIRAVLAMHGPVEWFEEVEPGDEVFDPDKPLRPFCRECTDDEYVEAVEMGYRIDQGSPVVYWPCATVAAVTSALGSSS